MPSHVKYDIKKSNLSIIKWHYFFKPVHVYFSQCSLQKTDGYNSLRYLTITPRL